MGLVHDYEAMKVKYFNVLTDNERNKTQIAEHIESIITWRDTIATLESERDAFKMELAQV